MLTKDEIDALMPKPYRSSGQQMSYDGYDKAHCHLFSLEQVRSVANDAIASHTSKVLEDVEPVARLLTWNGPAHQPVPHDGIAARTFAEFPVDTPAKDRYWFEGELLYPASTVAALKSERDALAARVAELEKDTARLEFVCNSPNRMVERENGLWRVYEDVAPTDRPTAVWQGITPRWHVTPREAIDAAITAALTKGQPAPQPQQEQSK